MVCGHILPPGDSRWKSDIGIVTLVNLLIELPKFGYYHDHIKTDFGCISMDGWVCFFRTSALGYLSAYFKASCSTKCNCWYPK